MSSQIIKPPEVESPIEDVEGYWRERGQDLVRGSIDALDESAKQIATIAGILEGLYFHAVTFSDLRNATITGWLMFVYLLPLILLLLSLVAALLVFFPETYKINLLSWEACKFAYQQVARSKRVLVRLSAINLALGIVSMTITLGLYFVVR